MTRVFLFLLTAPVAVASATDCTAQASLAPDLNVNYTCSGEPPADTKVEAFLRGHGFEVANPERMRRQLGAGFFPMDIEAIDSRQWTVEFRGLNDNPDPASTANTNYFVDVVSPPPTVHDTKLETALIAFVGSQSGCKIISTSRHENPATAAGMFDFTLKIRRSRMHEAAVCDQIEPTYDSKACDDVPGVRELKARQP